MHRHAAFAVDDLDAIEAQLKSHGIEMLIGPNNRPPHDIFRRASEDAWNRMYRRNPLFVYNPSGNLIELVPAAALRSVA